MLRCCHLSFGWLHAISPKDSWPTQSVGLNKPNSCHCDGSLWSSMFWGFAFPLLTDDQLTYRPNGSHTIYSRLNDSRPNVVEPIFFFFFIFYFTKKFLASRFKKCEQQHKWSNPRLPIFLLRKKPGSRNTFVVADWVRNFANAGFLEGGVVLGAKWSRFESRQGTQPLDLITIY